MFFRFCGNGFRGSTVFTGVHASEQKERSKKVFGGWLRALPCHLVWQIPFVHRNSVKTPRVGVFSFGENRFRGSAVFTGVRISGGFKDSYKNFVYWEILDFFVLL